MKRNFTCCQVENTNKSHFDREAYSSNLSFFVKLVFAMLFGLSICLNTYAQNDTIMILGKVVDAKNNPVENANILNLSNKAGTISNSNGYFYITEAEFPINLTISRIGFEKSNLTITKKAFEGIETYLVIHLKKKTYELEEVKIVSEKPDVIITKQANWIILDFKIAEEKLLVLLQKGPSRKLKIFNIDTLSYFEVGLPIKGNELYQDCMGNLHLFTEDSIYQMQTDLSDSTISLYATYSIEKFNNSLANCVGYINKKFIFKSVFNHNQEVRYWYLKDKNKIKLYDIYDKKRELFAQNFLDQKNILIERFGHIDEMGDISVTALHIKRKIKLYEWSYQYIGMVPAYNPLFTSFDTILIFDNIQQHIVFFDSAFSFQKEVPILYQTSNSKRIFQDKATGRFYIESLSDANNEFYEIELNTGRTSKIVKLENSIFPEKVCFYRNKLYYLDDNLGNIKSLKALTIK